jgi:hypothetical protein
MYINKECSVSPQKAHHEFVIMIIYRIWKIYMSNIIITLTSNFNNFVLKLGGII